MSRRTRYTAAGIAFIHRPIAVVIFSVTNFGLRVDDLRAGKNAILAGQNAIGAFSERSRHRTRRSAPGIAFVYLPVAIIIGAIAGLRPWHIRLGTNGRSADAVENARSANSRLAGIARNVTARVTFVRLAIAVVIQTVTQFGRRKTRLRAGKRPTRALHHANATNADLTHDVALGSAAGIAFVDVAIAVIIEAVANFLDWL